MPPQACHHHNVPPEANGSSTPEAILPQNCAPNPIGRAQRQQRPPVWYHDDNGEYIDFGGIDLEDDISKEEPPPKSCVPSQHTVQFPAVPSCNILVAVPVPGSAAQTAPGPLQTSIGLGVAQNVAPAQPLASRTAPNARTCHLPGAKLTSVNIHHFFEKIKKVSTTCCQCKVRAEVHKETWRSYWYSPSMSNTSLHTHIVNWHLEEYLILAEEHEWTLRAALTQSDFDIHKLPPPPAPEPSDAAPGNFLMPGWHLRQGCDGVPEFTVAAMHKQIIWFIVADDQSINVIECPEFHHLILLLHQDLQDTDIPHHTKLHELILEAWRDYFRILKQDLAKALG
ncbi:hypothetical protein EDC04DRAFT_2901106 [Pisolithus marmoratus]|nr:hypothetical protein EDC04DRAFT_2901106 [Pisolithus marmoratus]